MRRRPIRVLPLSIRSLADFDWNGEADEREIALNERRLQNRLAKLHRLEKLWAAEDTERLRRRAAELALVVAKDRLWLEQQAVLEERLQKIQAYYARAHEEEAQLERAALLKRLEKATKEINADKVREEREVLARRGVLRGRRK